MTERIAAICSPEDLLLAVGGPLALDRYIPRPKRRYPISRAGHAVTEALDDTRRRDLERLAGTCAELGIRPPWHPTARDFLPSRPAPRGGITYPPARTIR